MRFRHGITLVWVTLAVATGLEAQSALEGSPHDLTAGAGGNPCGFCHTPHGGAPGTPLWSRRLSDAVYQIYQSSSLQADVGQPTGASKLCLSCHDGTVAPSESLAGMSLGRAADLGTDLSDDHPISFVYSAALAARDSHLKPPSSLPPPVTLDAEGQLQCTTCHDPHDNRYGDFLVMANQGSRLCLQCHDFQDWAFSAHATATGTLLDLPLPDLQQDGLVDMAEAGCRICHQTHGARRPERLLRFAPESETCLVCHGGAMGPTNIRTELLKPSRHPVGRSPGLHRPDESPQAMVLHVECSDCHDPHRMRAGQDRGGTLPGALEGVSGVSLAGTPVAQVQHEYEVCFKCHADYANRRTPAVPRELTQSNVRLEFDPSGPSYHPVVAPGVNANVPSLKPPLTVASQITCGDCHGSDAEGARGPHGSLYEGLLVGRYETADFTVESAYAYELCYRCHSRNSILNDESFPHHRTHLERQAPCSACHDAHGISASQGDATHHSHLINFDITIVRRSASLNQRRFEDLGVFHGRCTLSCHGQDHAGWEY